MANNELSEIQKTVIRNDERLAHIEESNKENNLILNKISDTLRLINESQVRLDEKIINMTEEHKEIKNKVSSVSNEVAELKIKVKENETFIKRTAVIFWSTIMLFIGAGIKFLTGK